jgi:cytochrome c553
MKLIKASQLRNAAAAGLHTGLLASALSAAAMIGDAHAAETRGGVAGKVAYCLDCHGASGQGYRGYYPMPRLAGQQPEYLKNQLQAFVEHRRTNNIMFNVAQGYHGALALPMPHIASQLSRNQIEELASYLSFLR